MKPLWRRITNSSFLKGVLAIGGGTAIAQAIGVAVMPILTRLYDPVAMAFWGLFVSFIGVASVATTLRYEVAVVAARQCEEAGALVLGALALSLVLSLVGGIVFEILRRNNWLGYGLFPEWASWLAISALVGANWGLILRYWATREGLFSLVGKFTIWQALGRALAQLALALLGASGLVLGEALGRWWGWLALWRSWLVQGTRLWSPAVLWRYRIYPLVQFPSSLLDTVALLALVPVFTTAYGPQIGGALTLTQRLVNFPIALIGAAVADVFYSKAAALFRHQPNSLPQLFWATAQYLLLLAVALGLVVRFVLPPQVPWLFGSAWSLAEPMMQAMAPWMSAMLVVSPLSRLIFLSRWSWMKLIYDLISLVVVTLPLWYHLEGAYEALQTVSWLKTLQLVLYFGLLVFVLAELAKTKGEE
ncbi:MAG: hypothetical protein QXO86_07095 [Nitrososphaerota archaeon]